MSTGQGGFALVLGCMDGRCQERGRRFAAETFGADYIDTVTEPGIDGILAGAAHPIFTAEELPTIIEGIRRKASVSARGHGSTQCIIYGHNECAGNPVQHRQHLEHLTRARKTVLRWNLFRVVRTAVFDPHWKIELHQ